jgi:hypothetical protein
VILLRCVVEIYNVVRQVVINSTKYATVLDIVGGNGEFYS